MCLPASHIFIHTYKPMTDRMNVVKDKIFRRRGKGHRHGYEAGWRHGYRLGACQSVLRRVASRPFPVRDAKVMYVPQGFEAIDSGVIEALQASVRECIVAEPQRMLDLALETKPDLLLVMNGLHVFPEEHHDHLDRIRGSGIRTAVWLADDPYFTDDTARNAPHYDYIFTHEMNCIEFYRSLGCGQVHYLPLATSSRIFHPRRTGLEYESDVCFIGNAFWNRVALFDELAPYLADKKVVIAGGYWERLSRFEMLKRHIRPGWTPIEETADYYNGAKIVINMHRPIEAGSDNRNGRNIRGTSINPRTYEISGCGTLQITDVREDLHHLYRPGSDIETFASASELRDKIEYYLNHEKERLAIALRGLRTTRENHMFADRLNRLFEIIFS